MKKHAAKSLFEKSPDPWLLVPQQAREVPLHHVVVELLAPESEKFKFEIKTLPVPHFLKAKTYFGARWTTAMTVFSLIAGSPSENPPSRRGKISSQVSFSLRCSANWSIWKKF